MGVPESRSSDLASLPLQRAGTQADGGAMEASSGIAERSATHRAMRSIILLLYRGVWRRLSACRVRTPANNCPLSITEGAHTPSPCQTVAATGVSGSTSTSSRGRSGRDAILGVVPDHQFISLQPASTLLRWPAEIPA